MMAQNVTTHGMCGTPEYRTWQAMLTRCSNPGRRDYKFYGGRGIRVCKRWRLFENFYADMGARPEGTTIDRINTNGNYTPGNCRWADLKTQIANRRKRKGRVHNDKV
jgi:hypothetical protein